MAIESNQNQEQPQAQRPGKVARFLRRAVFYTVCLLTLVGAFYAIENWRGQRRWDRVRKELEAKGAHLDWASFIPEKISDEQNIFKAPHMQEWFVKGEDNSGSLSQRLSKKMAELPRHKFGNQEWFLVAQLTVATPGSGAGSDGSSAVLKMNDANMRQRLEKVLREAIGPSLEGAQNIPLMARALDEIKPVDLVLETESPPTLEEITALLPKTPPLTPGSTWKATKTDGPSFRLLISLRDSWCTADDYLAWSQQFEPDFEVIRNALKRPYARMDGDYEVPFAVPIQNFVAVRTVAQTIAQRAQCHLLVGRPEAAVSDLILLRDLCRMLEAQPAGKPMTLVAAMINVAIGGLYVAIVKEGCSIGHFNESQLAIVQKETSKIDLIPLIVSAFEGERAGVGHLLLITKPADQEKVFDLFNSGKTWWERNSNPTRLMLLKAPRGWVLQNQATVAELEQELIGGFDTTNYVVFPAKIDAAGRMAEHRLSHYSPYTFMASMVVPNFTKASLNLARNQTLANQAVVACGLERYRLAHGQYPESLDLLKPEIIKELPHDLVGGKPLQYRRNQNGGYLLYSIGWNQRDDGGKPSERTDEGDWVWTSD